MELRPLSEPGHYEPGAFLGNGALGYVYQARDTRMGRDVAIKVMRQPLTDQFEREARSSTALNHPNICTLYEVGPNYLVMELTEGPTLDERIRQGALPLDEAISIAKQIASALEAAHDKGILHRNLNPAKVSIRPDGLVKVRGFGLAPDSLPWVIFGAQLYLSPERLYGEALDQRADIWAFGFMLYEMVTGRRPFDGLPALAGKEADLTRAPEKTRPLLSRCLQKDPQKRLRDIGDAMALLE
jgi:serine/threonine-protein kinase